MCSSGSWSMAFAASQAARAAAMSRSRSWVSQVKPSPMTLSVTCSGKRSSRWRSPVSRRPLTNCTTPSLRPCPRQRIARPQAAVLLPLPVPVWTISRPFSMVLDA